MNVYVMFWLFLNVNCFISFFVSILFSFIWYGLDFLYGGLEGLDKFEKFDVIV